MKIRKLELQSQFIWLSQNEVVGFSEHYLNVYILLILLSSMSSNKGSQKKKDINVNSYETLQQVILSMEIGESFNFNFNNEKGEKIKTVVLGRIK